MEDWVCQIAVEGRYEGRIHVFVVAVVIKLRTKKFNEKIESSEQRING